MASDCSILSIAVHSDNFSVCLSVCPISQLSARSWSIRYWHALRRPVTRAHLAARHKKLIYYVHARCRGNRLPTPLPQQPGCADQKHFDPPPLCSSITRATHVFASLMTVSHWQLSIGVGGCHSTLGGKTFLPEIM